MRSHEEPKATVRMKRVSADSNVRHGVFRFGRLSVFGFRDSLSYENRKAFGSVGSQFLLLFPLERETIAR